jgi:hypothetical protein
MTDLSVHISIPEEPVGRGEVPPGEALAKASFSTL